MVRHACVIVALVGMTSLGACKHHEAEPPPPIATRVPVLPDSITGQLGTIGFALAIDLQRLDVPKVAAMIPDDPPCIREVLKSAKIGAATKSGDEWQGYLSGISERVLRTCVDKFAPMFGATTKDHAGGGFELAVPGQQVVVQWYADTAVITEGSAAPHAGDPPTVILDLLGQVPKTAAGWIVSSGFPAYKIKSVVAWIEADAATWTFTVLAEATVQDQARPWVESIVSGFKQAAVAKGVPVDDAWFTLTSTPTAAKLVARIPITAFAVTGSR